MSVDKVTRPFICWLVPGRERSAAEIHLLDGFRWGEIAITASRKAEQALVTALAGSY